MERLSAFVLHLIDNKCLLMLQNLSQTPSFTELVLRNSCEINTLHRNLKNLLFFYLQKRK